VRLPGATRLLTLGALGVLGVASAACSSAPTTTSGPSPAPVGFPPAQVMSGATGSWATLAMGHLDDPINTFGELLYRPGGPTCPGVAPCAPGKWVLATPPGVASNGGMFVAVDPSGTLTAGFGVSLDLTFSPLAVTSDAATTWTTGILPVGLAPVTDALAASGPDRLALVSTDGGRVLASTGDLSTWSVVARRASVATAATGSGCAPGPLGAVAVTAIGDDLVATTCGSGHRAGIFRVGTNGVAGVVTPVGPVLPGVTTGPVRVDRMVATPAGLSALVVAGSGPATRLFVATSAGGTATWTVSSPYDTGARVVSTSVDGSGGTVVVLANGAHLTAASVDPGGSWTTLPALPAGTAVVAGGPSGEFSALVPAGSTLTVDVLSGGTWSRHQVLTVPIQYGSSG
jgi:hypothetical protein